MSTQNNLLISKSISDWFKKNQKLCLLMVVLLSLLVFSAIVSVNPTINEIGRNDDPWTIAQHVYQGKGYSACDTRYFPSCENTDRITAMREPIMVLQFYLAMKLFGESLFSAFLVEYLLFLGVMLCLYYLVKVNANSILACLAAFLWITYLPLKDLFINNTGDLSATFWFSLSLVFFHLSQKSWKRHFLILGGLALGLAILSRSAMLIPSAVIILFHSFGVCKHTKPAVSRYWKNGMILMLVVGFVISPWLIRNYQVFGKPMMTSLTGYNLFRHNSPIQKPHYLHYVGSIEAKKYQTRFLKTLPYSIETADEGEMNQIYQDAAIQLIMKYPDRYLALSVYRSIPLWFNIGVPDEWERKDTFIFIQQSILLVMLLSGIILSRPRPWMYFACIVAYCAGHMAIDGQVRYLIPMIPLILFVGMAGLNRLTSDRP